MTSRRLGRSATLAAALVLSGSTAGAEDLGGAHRVCELAPDEGWQNSAWAQHGLAWGAKALLDFHDTPVGREPWISDGTRGGTRLLADLLPGDAGSEPIPLAEVASRIYFSADLPGRGRELWVSDGSAAGTIPLGDLHAGPRGSNPMPLGALGGLFLFSAEDRSAGRELWRSDGTPSGTWRIGDLRPGPESFLEEVVQGPAPAGAVGSFLLFRADDGVHGPELWRTDGTAAGTGLIYKFEPGAGGGVPTAFSSTTLGLFFRARTPAAGEELWVSDGSHAGTRPVRDLRAGPGDSEPEPLGQVGQRLLFAGDDGVVGRELWSTDGTAAGTHLVRDIAPGSTGSDPRPGAVLDGRLVFAADDGVRGSEPWISDGSQAGTALLSDLSPEPWGSTWFGARATAGGRLFFDVSIGGELRVGVTDGTRQGTHAGAVLGDDYYAWMEGLVGAGSRVLATVCSDSCGPCPTWCGTFATDATEEGTEEILEFRDFEGSYPSSFSARGDDVLFQALSRLYASDGTEAGTDLLRSASGESVLYPRSFAPLSDGEYVFGAWRDEEGQELWRSLPDEAVLVRNLYAGYQSGLFGSNRRIGDLVYFAGAGDPLGAALWTTDGTYAGTRLVESFLDYYGRTPSSIVDGFGRAWFFASDAESGYELWESRGTAATTILHELEPGPGPELGEIDNLTPFRPSDDSVLLRLRHGIHRVSAASEPPVLLHTLSPETEFHDLVFPIAVVGSVGLFFDLEADGSCSLWRTDGRPSGTARVAKIGGSLRGAGYCPEELVTVGPHAYFAACTVGEGCELWRTDATAAGTTRVMDREPGPLSFSPTKLTAIAGRLYFSACTSGHGCEPWISDGTAAGTHPVGDLNPGLPSSKPAGFAPAQGRIFFSADDGHGAEPWVMPQELFYDGFERGTADRWSVTSR